VLTRRLQTDPGLMDTAAVIFDEIHERNLQTDLGLALALHSRRPLPPDLRLLAMSATVDADRIAAVVDGSGRLLGCPHPSRSTSAGGRLPRRTWIEDHAAAVDP
jgi:HrpA-like RNA helicase